MRQLPLLIALLASACESSPPTAFPIADLRSREGALRSGVALIDLQIEGAGQLTTLPGDEESGVTYMYYSAVVHAQLLSAGWQPIASPTRLALLYTRSSWSDMTPRRVDWQSGYGVSEISQGARYLVVFQQNTPSRTGSPNVLRLSRVDANGRLLDAAFGFPPGTPVSTVLDPEGIPAWILNEHDAGAPSDG